MAELAATNRQDIIDGLMATSAHISPKYFYDVQGSHLFEAITRMPEYYPTRTEREIMRAQGAEIAQKVGAGGTAIELGAGSCEKARVLCDLIRPETFVAVDISAEFLHEAVDGLRAAFPAMAVHPVGADLMDEIVLPATIPRPRRLVFYPGSSIGNFDPPHARDLLRRIRQLLEDDGTLLIGVDLVKEIAALEAAYDDAAGLTAAFNLNVLDHVNRLIGSDFDRTHWQHRAFFNTVESRIEMHLEATADSHLRWPGGERMFTAGERIHTENSYKYRVADFRALLARAGFSTSEVWTDARDWFAVFLARP
jgi:dimethylhistidine N-methyltransferase